MAIVEDDLTAGIERLIHAIKKLAGEMKTEHREQVCIETRAVFAIFEDESHWLGVEDKAAKQQLIDLFSRADELMSKTQDDNYCAVSRRLNELRKRNFTKTSIAF
jgi:hypothetical protein